ncbi:MAG TPA: GNAT family N-acetyltransferase [Frankiaceae bacterium]|nr:GNAT family N-acetyltransferase [Frankiaceae bacterium]
MSEPDLRPVPAEEFDAFAAVVERAFGEEATPEDLERERALFEPDRSLGAYLGDELVGGTWALSLTMSVPGGLLPVAGVTGVGVSSVHRRRGVLTALMHRQLRDVRERGTEAVAALWASEAAIYGRYGYGLAAPRAVLRVEKAHAAFRGRPRDDVRLRLVEPGPKQLGAIWDTVLPTRPGCVARDEGRWQWWLDDLPSRRHGASPLVAVLAEGDEPEGYVLYRTKPDWGDTGPAGEVRVHELVSATPRAREALWRHVLHLDLMASTEWWNAPPDEPLPHLLADPRRADLRLRDGVFVRLVDVPRALSGRRYAAPVSVTFDLVDATCPWNSSRWHLSADGDGDGASCVRTDRPADLVALSAAELGAVFLGGPSLAVLAAADRVDEHAPGAVVAASRAFAGDLAPWCPDVF